MAWSEIKGRAADANHLSVCPLHLTREPHSLNTHLGIYAVVIRGDSLNGTVEIKWKNDVPVNLNISKAMQNNLSFKFYVKIIAGGVLLFVPTPMKKVHFSKLTT